MATNEVPDSEYQLRPSAENEAALTYLFENLATDANSEIIPPYENVEGFVGAHNDIITHKIETRRSVVDEALNLVREGLEGHSVVDELLNLIKQELDGNPIDRSNVDDVLKSVKHVLDDSSLVPLTNVDDFLKPIKQKLDDNSVDFSNVAEVLSLVKRELSEKGFRPLEPSDKGRKRHELAAANILGIIGSGMMGQEYAADFVKDPTVASGFLTVGYSAFFAQDSYELVNNPRDGYSRALNDKRKELSLNIDPATEAFIAQNVSKIEKLFKNNKFINFFVSLIQKFVSLSQRFKKKEALVGPLTIAAGDVCVGVGYIIIDKPVEAGLKWGVAGMAASSEAGLAWHHHFGDKKDYTPHKWNWPERFAQYMGENFMRPLHEYPTLKVADQYQKQEDAMAGKNNNEKIIEPATPVEEIDEAATPAEGNSDKAIRQAVISSQRGKIIQSFKEMIYDNSKVIERNIPRANIAARALPFSMLMFTSLTPQARIGAGLMVLSAGLQLGESVWGKKPPEVLSVVEEKRLFTYVTVIFKQALKKPVQKLAEKQAEIDTWTNTFCDQKSTGNISKEDMREFLYLSADRDTLKYAVLKDIEDITKFYSRDYLPLGFTNQRLKMFKEFVITALGVDDSLLASPLITGLVDAKTYPDKGKSLLSDDPIHKLVESTGADYANTFINGDVAVIYESALDKKSGYELKPIPLNAMIVRDVMNELSGKKPWTNIKFEKITEEPHLKMMGGDEKDKFRILGWKMPRKEFEIFSEMVKKMDTDVNILMETDEGQKKKTCREMLKQHMVNRVRKNWIAESTGRDNVGVSR